MISIFPLEIAKPIDSLKVIEKQINLSFNKYEANKYIENKISINTLKKMKIKIF